MISKIAAGLVVLRMLAMPALAAQMQGPERTQTIATVAGNCVDKNVKKSEYRPYTVAALDAYCTCLGTSIVDGFTLEELESAGKQMTPAFEKRRDAMDQKCVADNFKVKAK